MPLLNLAHRSARYQDGVKPHPGKHASNNSTRRRHKARRLLIKPVVCARRVLRPETAADSTADTCSEYLEQAHLTHCEKQWAAAKEDK